MVLIQVPMDERNGHRAFADGRCDALDRTVPYISDRERTGDTRFEIVWLAVQGPTIRCASKVSRMGL